MPRGRTWTDDDLRHAVATSTTMAEVVHKLRLTRGGAAYTTVRTRMEVLGLTMAGRAPQEGRAVPDGRSRTEELREAVAQARSLNEVFRLLGLVPGGSQWLVIRQQIREQGWSTAHWEQPLTSSAPPQTDAFRSAVAEADLSALVQRCRSRAEVIRALGFEPTRSTYRILHEQIARNGIDTAHFEAGHAAMRRSRRRRYRTTLDEVLVEGSSYVAVATLKRRLIEEGLLEPRCRQCGIDAWQGQPIVLHLDHINGIRNDHRLENLRLLCPNCHSQTETYCGRNKGRYRGG
jgi:5-methylcytosine-specific restriction endonuclease McrA